MVREIISVHVGQCGNQIGRAFWKQVLAEHANHNQSSVFEPCMSTFFRNVDDRTGLDLPIGDGRESIYGLKARAVLIDMEDGPISETIRGDLGDLFDQRHIVTDVHGSGNNWAHGNAVYGPKYKDDLLETFRRGAELCDSLQSFFLMHSLGGGTGSGLGTYLLNLLEDHFPDVHRFSTVVFPSEDDDVITSPYNCVLALRELTEQADCVMPVDNTSLSNIATTSSLGPDGRGQELEPKVGLGFDHMNHVVARLLTDLTASMRFAGDLNVDLNEITSNLVPFPQLHYLLSSLTPFPTLHDTISKLHIHEDPREARRSHRIEAIPVKQMFSSVFSRRHQLMQAHPRKSRYLACGLMVRGDIVVSDVNASIERISSEIDMIGWNREGFKIGICSVPPVRHRRSLLCLANNCCIKDTFGEVRSRFMQMYERRAMLHHYTQYMDRGIFQEALESLESLISDYEDLGRQAVSSGERSLSHLRPMF